VLKMIAGNMHNIENDKNENKISIIIRHELLTLILLNVPQTNTHISQTII
jgi:hypothetical protein